MQVLASARRAATCSQTCATPTAPCHPAVGALQRHSQHERVNRVRCRTTSSGMQSPVAIDYFQRDKRPIILFDGVCNLCNGGVNFVLDWDKQGAFRFAALQSRPGRQLLMRCGRQPDDISSIVLVEEDRCYIKSDAVLRIANKLSIPLPLMAMFLWPVPKIIRDPMYDQVANNRYAIFGKTNNCRVTEDDFSERFLGA